MYKGRGATVPAAVGMMLPISFTRIRYNMEDPVLNRSLEETRDLHIRWGQFRDFVLMAIKSRKVTAQAEMKFLELKSRIAMLHDGFMTRLDHDQKTGQNIMSIVADCIMLKRAAGYSDAEKQKFEFDWNECYLLLTEQLGALEEEQKRLANINVRAYNAQKRREMMVAQIHNFMHSLGLKVAVGLFIAFMLLWGVPAFGIYDYKNLGKYSWSQKPYKAFVNFVWRPYISMNLEYMSWDEVRQIGLDDRNWTKENNGAIMPDTNLAKKLTANFFKRSELNGMGFKGKYLTDIGKAFDANTKFVTEGFVAQSQQARFYYVLFQTAKDAEAFTTAMVNAYNALPEAKRKQIGDNVLLLRRANLVSIGVSTHLHRGWAGDKFYFENKEKDDLFQ